MMLPSREAVSDFAPLAARGLDLDPNSLIRIVSVAAIARCYVRLPYDVLAGRAIALKDDLSAADRNATVDCTMSVADFLNWQDSMAFEPAGRDAEWLSPVPPPTGWRQLDTITDDEIRSIVRAGALTARSEVDPRRQQALMEATVMTVSTASGGADSPIEVRLAAASLLTKLGFLPRGTDARVDVHPAWVRLTATLGSIYQSRGKDSISPLRLLS